MSPIASFTGAALEGVRLTTKRQVIRGVPRMTSGREKEAYWLFHNLSVEVEAGDALVMVARDPERTNAILRVWAGLLPIDSGQVHRPDSSLLLVPSKSRWVRELSVAQSIRMLAGTYGLTDSEVESVFTDVARTAQVAGKLNQPIEGLDRQVRHQIAFAIAIHAPVDMVMFDHTASTGSPDFRPLCPALIAGIREAGKAVVIATAKPQVALQSGTRGLIVRNKRAQEVEVAEAANFLLRDREKGRRRAKERVFEDDEDDDLGFGSHV